MNSRDYASSVSALTGLGPLRVWSLLVTVFGDLAPDGSLDGPAISALMAEIGIKPEATRVALHRLRGDGWIASQRSGRTSLHKLTEKGSRATQAARPRIYGAPHEMNYGVQVIVTREAGANLNPVEFRQISPRIFVTGADTTLPADAMPLAPLDLPHWLGAQIETPATRNAYASLYAVLLAIDTETPPGFECSPVQCAVLRVLIVHVWRRLVLRHPDLPRSAHSDAWRGHDCRALITTLLTRLPRPAPDEILAA